MSELPPQPPTFYPPTYATSAALSHNWSDGVPVDGSGAPPSGRGYSNSPAFDSHQGFESPEAGPSGSGSGGGGGAGNKGKRAAEGGGDGQPPEKKKATRGARACTKCRAFKMRCTGGENGPPCDRCKKGGHECIFEESQRGKRSNRKTDAMAKSLKSMEAKLESVLASISNPGLLAGSGGLVTDVSQRLPPAPLDSGPFGAEGRGDVHVGVDPGVVASALEQIRSGRSGTPAMAPSTSSAASRPTLAAASGRQDSESAIVRREPILLPSIAQTQGAQYDVGGGVGPYAEIGPSRTGGHPLHTSAPMPHPHPIAHPHVHHHVHFSPGTTNGHGMSLPPVSSAGGGGARTVSVAGSSTSKSSPMEWSGVKDPNAADGSPRLHSLPDNTLNPLGLLAEASLRNTRKRPVDLTEEYDVTAGDDGEANGSSAAGGKGKGKGKVKGKGKKGPAGAEGVDGAKEKGKEGEKDEGAGSGDEEGMGKKKKKELGMANRNYFAPGPMNILPLRRIVIEQRMPPALLEEKILSVEEVVELFALFFEHCARHCPFLDPEIHTPAATGSRSPFLFTCICTVASRYYTKRTDDLYRKCLRIAKRVAFDVMSKGYKSTEICQGFLLLCNWNQPAERFEEERTYQFSGLAIRMATDLNLHRKTIAQLPPDVGEETKVLYERELLNRERAWIYSFIIDRSVATQMGKPAMISKEDFIVRNASVWHRQPGTMASDSGLSAMVELLRIVSRMIDVLYSDTRSVSGLNAHLDYLMLIRAFLQQLDQWRQDWSDPVLISSDPDNHSLTARALMRDYYWDYYRLFLLSFAVQHALDDPASKIDLPSYCVLCFESAERMIVLLRDFFGPQGILRYAIDSTFVYATYAAVFLLKLVSPTFASFIDEQAAMKLVRELADTLEAAAVDEQHTPALYASFLRMLIDNKLNGPRTATNSRAPTRPGSPVPGSMNGGIFVNDTSGMSGMNGASNGNTGLDSFLKSRAPSVGPEGMNGMGGNDFGINLGFPAELGGTGAFNFGGEFGGTGDGNLDSLMVDNVLDASGFWSSMLMPGFGGASVGLSGGSGTVLSGAAGDPFSVTPFHSRPASPSHGASTNNGATSFSFDLPASSAPTPAASGAVAPAAEAPAPVATEVPKEQTAASVAEASSAQGAVEVKQEVQAAEEGEQAAAA
ncbi:zn(2)-C6 transcription factor [Rhodotorula toruloides]|uniref:Zn(2)-C6 transcription factor n=1 Tax=Rhodotorula toruloides TaxID=5286 RepID=A0A511KIF3_RHOTO|nr:zn(2)-C6 transcription factor [Rhodotorula toruloides]